MQSQIQLLSPERIKYYLQLKSILYFSLFYPKNQLVSLGTFLPVAERGLGTCQFLRWPNTEGLISSKCSLPLALCAYVWETKCEWENHTERRRRVCMWLGVTERKKKRMQWDTESRGRWMQHFPILHILHNMSQWEGLHNPAQLLSTHLITNGD